MSLSGGEKEAIHPLASDLWGSAAMLEENFFGMDGGWFPSGLGVDVPNANVSESERELKIELAAPGLERKDFQVEVIGHTLRVRVKRAEETCNVSEGYSLREYSLDSFIRSFAMPQTGSIGDIDAKYERGILKISIPKMQETPGKSVIRIPVK